MVQWSSPAYEEEVITGFQEHWVEVQAYWMNMDETRSQANDTQLGQMLAQFNEYLNEVHDDGDLAQGSAKFLLAEWKAIEAKAKDCWAGPTHKPSLGRVQGFGSLLREFEEKEQLYDPIVEYRGTTVSDEESDWVPKPRSRGRSTAW
jgi:hypothetical protein